jgi:HAMP domain-containing protein
VIDRYLEKEPKSSRLPDFVNRRRRSPRSACSWTASRRAGDGGGRRRSQGAPEFESHFAMLTHNLNRMRRPAARRERADRAAAVRRRGDGAVDRARAGGGGLGGRGRALLFTLRTLRPLSVLARPRAPAGGGDYSQRTGVTSRDEIGDLAREFDAMAEAIQEREHRLIRSERLATVGRMAAHIAHEVRNPLASIGLNAELLGDEIVDRGDEARRLVTSIIGEVDRLTEITETYLRFARCRARSWNARTRRDRGVGRGRCRAASWPRPGRRSPSTSRPGCPMSRPTRPAPAGAHQPDSQRARGDVGARRARLDVSVRDAAGGSRSSSTTRVRASARRYRQDLRSVLLDQGAGHRSGAGAGAADRRRARRTDRGRQRRRNGVDLHGDAAGGRDRPVEISGRRRRRRGGPVDGRPVPVPSLS